MSLRKNLEKELYHLSNLEGNEEHEPINAMHLHPFSPLPCMHHSSRESICLSRHPATSTNLPSYRHPWSRVLLSSWGFVSAPVLLVHTIFSSYAAIGFLSTLGPAHPTWRIISSHSIVLWTGPISINLSKDSLFLFFDEAFPQKNPFLFFNGAVPKEYRR